MKENAENSSAKTNNKKGTDKSWFAGMDAGGVMNNAQRILNTAVGVLEEEIAAGILAAKKIEKKVINVDEVRSGSSEELMSRIRRDTHEAVDIFLDAMSVIANYVTSLSATVDKAKQNEATKEAARPMSGYQVPVVKNDMPAKAGETTLIVLEFTNDSNEQSKDVVLKKADLLGPEENKIPSRNITVNPSIFTLGPLSKQQVSISIKVPSAGKPGSYSGLLRDSKNTNMCTVMVVDVI